jgi:predicted nucleic acid-binding protein
LVVAHACHGRLSYDARLVAAMRTHGITRLLTLIIADFTRFPGISILDPAAFAGATAPTSTIP